MIIHGLSPHTWEVAATGHGYTIETTREGLQAWKREPGKAPQLVGKLYPKGDPRESWLDTGGPQPTERDLRRCLERGWEP
jgi:hypothetical protein